MPPEVDRILFLRADMVEVTSAALFAKVKGTETTLAQQLITQGVFTAEEFTAAFPEEPFAISRQVDIAVTEAIATRETLGLLEQNQYAAECHIVAEIVPNGDQTDVYALVCRTENTLQKGNETGFSISSSDLWLITLDAESLAYQYCETLNEMGNLTRESAFPEQS